MIVIGFDRNRARYGMVFFPDKHVVVIIDEYEDAIPTRTVTNDAEAVIADLVRDKWLPEGDRVVYRDTEGQWDELLVKDGRFAGFAFLGKPGEPVTDMITAVKRAARPA
jgi:hypothetical protein